MVARDAYQQRVSECVQFAEQAVDDKERMTWRELEHVPPQLNQGDSRGAEDGRGYRH